MSQDTNRLEKDFQDWRDLVSWLTDTPSGWIYRGLPSYSYAPISRLERILKKESVPLVEWRDRENATLAYFKEQAKNYVVDVPEQNDLLGWLSLMQHYGAPTRLTDWTVSPFIEPVAQTPLGL